MYMFCFLCLCLWFEQQYPGWGLFYNTHKEGAPPSGLEINFGPPAASFRVKLFLTQSNVIASKIKFCLPRGLFRNNKTTRSRLSMTDFIENFDFAWYPICYDYKNFPAFRTEIVAQLSKDAYNTVCPRNINPTLFFPLSLYYNCQSEQPQLNQKVLYFWLQERNYHPTTYYLNLVKNHNFGFNVKLSEEQCVFLSSMLHDIQTYCGLYIKNMETTYFNPNTLKINLIDKNQNFIKFDICPQKILFQTIKNLLHGFECRLPKRHRLQKYVF